MRKPREHEGTFKRPTDYEWALYRHGFRKLGGGFFSSVWAKGDQPWVIKVFGGGPLDPWPLYAEWCFYNPGPFRPVIRALKWHQGFYVAVVERFVVTVDDLAQGRGPARRQGPCRDADLFRQALALKYAPNGFKKCCEAIEKLGLHAASQFIQLVAETFPNQYLDIHGANWMYREDGSLVLIDPFSDEKHEIRAVRLKRAA